MNTDPEKGFTLIELILVVAIAGMIAVVAVPSLMKARDAADSAAAIGQLRAIHTNQEVYRSQAGRYGRLSEISAFAGNTHGRVVGTTLRHKDFIYLMFPNPTNATLRSQYNIIAYRIRQGRVISHYQMSQDGEIVTIIP